MYWFEGSIPHLISLWLFIFVALNRKRLALPFIVFLGVLLGAFSESFSLMLLSGFCLWYCVHRSLLLAVPDKRFSLLMLCMFFGLAVDLFAPGNYKRMGIQRASTEMPGLWELVGSTLIHWFDKPGLFLLVMLCYAFAKTYFMEDRTISKVPEKQARYVLIISLLTTLPAMGLCVYLYRGDFNSHRAMLAPYTLIALAVLYWMHSLAYYIAQHENTLKIRVPAAFAIILLVIITPQSLETLKITFMQAPYQRAATMAQFEAAYTARAEGRKTLTVPLVENDNSMLYWEPLMSDPNHYLNRLFARYFGLEHVTAIPSTKSNVDFLRK